MCSVSACAVSECAYNTGRACHAISVTIAAGPHPVCGTFLKSSTRSGSEGKARVGECRSAACRYNADSRCSAPSIQVDYCWGHVDCRTYAN
ncbi:MAG TPA: DUF1540 domain-containing protein [Burkholderiales bacterium]|nr:DUF1540 domain-containing protein [Burkholderiales bacterium]